MRVSLRFCIITFLSACWWLTSQHVLAGGIEEMQEPVIFSEEETSVTNTAGQIISEDIDLVAIKRLSDFNIKTNGVFWGVTIINLEGEWMFNPQWSVELGLVWCPWKLSNNFSVKTAAILPECRWWFKDVSEGHFLGLHGSLAWYNVRWHDFRYQDSERPLLGVGITYGYKFRFDDNWGLELSVGAGYANMKYDRFYNVKNGAMIDRRLTNYFGIDRFGVSVVYRFDR